VADELEQERLELLARLHALEANHARLKAHPHDRKGHERHQEELAAYQNDVRSYRSSLVAIPRERGLPDPALDPFD
jgi:hypothetical protein